MLAYFVITVKLFSGCMGLFVLKELLRFVWKKRLWWLFPVVIMLILVAALIIFGQSSALSPFVYSLF
jgi:hypothetical protein